MLKTKYCIVPGLTVVEHKPVICYGILCIYGSKLSMIRNISLDRRKLKAAVKLFNCAELSPLHFADAVEDFLSD